MSENTVFVIGAGASAEAGLPVGYELRFRIAALLNFRHDNNGKFRGDPVIYGALQIHMKNAGERDNMNPYMDAASLLSGGLPQDTSIDNFIHSHRDNTRIALLGKLAIVRSILNAERNSKLSFSQFVKKNRELDFSGLQKSWYMPFFNLLIENNTDIELEEKLKYLTLVIFNYDRCIEHYLCFAIHNYYEIDWDRAAELVNCINIFHPYGNVGRLPFEKQSGAIEYGAEPDPVVLLKLSKGIKTFTEGTDTKSSEITEIKKCMGKATHLVFLGFAFHELNMKLLVPEAIDRKNKNINRNCFASTSGISDGDNRGIVIDQIKALYNGYVTLKTEKLKCWEFFGEFERRLSF